jgi:hypothetical protein
MTTAVRVLLESFDALSEAEPQEAAVEILRRMIPEGELPEQALVEAADELFRMLDAEEASGGHRPLSDLSAAPGMTARDRSPPDEEG